MGKQARTAIAERIDHIQGMSPMDRAWLAGLCEGEASFTFVRWGEKRYPRWSLAMTDRDVMERVSSLCGGLHIGVRQIDKRAKRSKPVYYMNLSGQPGVELMRFLLPFMGARRSAKITEMLGGAA